MNRSTIKTRFVLYTTRSLINTPEQARQWLDTRHALKTFFTSGLFLFTPQGRLIVESPQLSNRRGLDFSFREYYRQTVATGKPYISNSYPSSKHNRPSIMMTVPVTGPDGQLIAIMGGVMELSGANTFFQTLTETRLGKTGYLYLFAQDRSDPDGYPDAGTEWYRGTACHPHP